MSFRQWFCRFRAAEAVDVVAALAASLAFLTRTDGAGIDADAVRASRRQRAVQGSGAHYLMYVVGCS